MIAVWEASLAGDQEAQSCAQMPGSGVDQVLPACKFF